MASFSSSPSKNAFSIPQSINSFFIFSISFPRPASKSIDIGNTVVCNFSLLSISIDRISFISFFNNSLYNISPIFLSIAMLIIIANISFCVNLLCLFILSLIPLIALYNLYNLSSSNIPFNIASANKFFSVLVNILPSFFQLYPSTIASAIYLELVFLLFLVCILSSSSLVCINKSLISSASIPSDIIFLNCSSFNCSTLCKSFTDVFSSKT